MKSRFWAWVVIGALALLSLALLDRGCQSDRELRDALAAAAEHAKIDEADAKYRAEFEATQQAIITQQDKKITELLVNAGKPSPAEVKKDEEIAALKGKVSALEAQGDLAGALAAAKDTIVQLEVKFNLAEERHGAALFALNAEWQTKFDAQKAIADARAATIAIKDGRIESLENALSKWTKSQHTGRVWALIGKYGVPLAFAVGVVVGK